MKRETVYRMAHSREIPAFRVGRAWRFFRSEVRDHFTAPRKRWAQPKRSTARKRAA